MGLKIDLVGAKPEILRSFDLLTSDLEPIFFMSLYLAHLRCKYSSALPRMLNRRPKLSAESISDIASEYYGQPERLPPGHIAVSTAI